MRFQFPKYSPTTLTFDKIQQQTIRIENNFIFNCKECKHFMPNKNILLDTYKYGKCKKFGYKDIVSGKIEYYNAGICRSVDKWCSKHGKHFEYEIKHQDKINKAKLISTIPIISPIILFVLHKCVA